VGRLVEQIKKKPGEGLCAVTVVGSHPYLRRDDRPSRHRVLLTINTSYWDSPGTQGQTPFTAERWSLPERAHH